MRQTLRSLGVPTHIGLAYYTWAPVGSDGKIPDERRGSWLSELAGLSVSRDYARAFDLWKASFTSPGDRLFELTLASRLLVGHGNTSATDVGITVHHTWGVPIVPGPALKGLLAHFMDAVYGPDNPTPYPWEQPEGERARAGYQGVTWYGRRIARGPGEVYRALFGAPDADEDGLFRERGIDAGASTGSVVFHDALYVPQSSHGDRPFAADVLTVHQKNYYDSSGEGWPSDYDRPNPIAFLTVRPGVRMLFALSGSPALSALAERLLVDALREWGVGGKTSAGYGRFVRVNDSAAVLGAGTRPSPGSPQVTTPRHQRGDRIVATRVEDPTGRGKVKFRTDDGFVGHFVGESPPQVGLGEMVEVWVANVSSQGYTLTLRPPKTRQR